MTDVQHQFLSDLDKQLWNAADRLRSALDAAVYKHIVLGLIFLKYVSDAFEDRRAELERRFRDPEDEYYFDPADYGVLIETEIAEALEDRDYYSEVNVFWVPEEARWSSLRDNARLPQGTMLPWNKPMRTVAFLLDDALAALKRANHRPGDNKIEKIIATDTFTKYEVSEYTLLGLIDKFSNTNFHVAEYNGQPLNLKSKDILGHVYEYFLGEFAQEEGKKGGQYYTPKSIVTLIVRMLRPLKGRVYDPAMGSGGFFIQSEEFLEDFSGRTHDKSGAFSVYGQENNPTTWRLAGMNMIIRGIDFNFGDSWADTFLHDLHPDLRADWVMANPPFNMREWGREQLSENDPRWKYGVPPANNANFAWVQHMLYHLAPTGSMALLLANGSMSSNTNGEGEIRRRIVEDDLVECMVALPGQLFTNTQIPACIWFLTKNKQERGMNGGRRRNRSGETLFIDARQRGYMKDRVLRDFRPDDIADIAGTFHRWQSGEGYEDVPGFCKSATIEQIRQSEFMLTPGGYVGASAAEVDSEPFAEKMTRLFQELESQFTQGQLLEAKIRAIPSKLGLPK